MLSRSRFIYSIKSIIKSVSSKLYFTSFKDNGIIDSIKLNKKANIVDAKNIVHKTAQDSKRDTIFDAFTPSNYKYDTEEWKNASKFPVLPDYQKLVSCLYGDNAEDFVKLPYNFAYAKDAESLIQTALENEEFEKAAELMSDPAAILMKAIELNGAKKSEECKKLLLHFTSTTTDSLSSLFCWNLLRELSHSPENPDEVTGIIYEVATENGNDIVAIYNDFSIYTIFSGGRSGYTRHFCKYPFYTDIEEAKSNFDNDEKIFGDLDISIFNEIRFSLTHNDGAPSVIAGAPVDESQIPALSNPKANTDILFYPETASCFKPEAKLDNSKSKTSIFDAPCRLIFLTPGGKRIIEASYSELKESQGGLQDVHKSLDSLLLFMKMVRSNDLKDRNCFPTPDKAATSEYVLKKMGVDKYSIPDKPLSIPNSIKERNPPAL